eukprot:gene27476-16332_t
MATAADLVGWLKAGQKPSEPARLRDSQIFHRPGNTAASRSQSESMPARNTADVDFYVPRAAPAPAVLGEGEVLWDQQRGAGGGGSRRPPPPRGSAGRPLSARGP